MNVIVAQTDQARLVCHARDTVQDFFLEAAGRDNMNQVKWDTVAQLWHYTDGTMKLVVSNEEITTRCLHSLFSHLIPKENP